MDGGVEASRSDAVTNARIQRQGLVSLNNRARAVLTGLAVGAVGLCLTTSPAIAVGAHALTAGLGAPQLQAVRSDDSSITVDFLAPVNDGGVAIFGYQDSIDGGATWHDLTTRGSTELTAFIGGLRNGTSYALKLRAVSDAGPGDIATADAVTPSTVPGAPLAVSAVAGDSSATVSFRAPADTGGAEIIDYQYRLNGGTWTSFHQLSALARTAQAPAQLVEPVTGLANGTVYALQVRAMNVRGGGPATDPVTITPSSVPFVLVAPVSTVLVGHSVTVTGRAPAGSTVQLYFRSRGQAGFVLRRTLTAGSDNLFSTSYVAHDDCAYYAMLGSMTTPTVLTKAAPTVVGPISRTVQRNSVVVESGTGVAGSTIEFHFHPLNSPATDYSVTRDVVVSAGGVWRRSFVAASELRFFITSKLNDAATPVHVVHVR